MSNGNYPSPEVAYQGVHALIGYGTVLTAGFRFHDWTYGFLAVLVFALVKEFIIDIFGKEHDSSSQPERFCILHDWRRRRHRCRSGQLKSQSHRCRHTRSSWNLSDAALNQGRAATSRVELRKGSDRNEF